MIAFNAIGGQSTRKGEERHNQSMLRMSNRAFRRNHKSRKGFTLIELLIVILVLAILMAVALPLYLAAVSDSQVKTCRSNMQTIANAEAAYKTQSSTHVYTTVLSDLNSNLGAAPVCPSGGSYSITIAGTGGGTSNGNAVPAGGLIVSCSATGHGTFAPGVDGS
jgi:type IV pilus assembly protein PilA